jgi:hypothetical protein
MSGTQPPRLAQNQHAGSLRPLVNLQFASFVIPARRGPQPSLVAHKHRQLELRAGHPATRGRRGTASGYSLKAVRDAERRLAEQAELAYQTVTAAWQPRPPAPSRPAGALPR